MDNLSEEIEDTIYKHKHQLEFTKALTELIQSITSQRFIIAVAVMISTSCG